MSAEKKLWRLPTPFRKFSGKRDPKLNAKTGPSRSRVSSVSLSDDSSTSDFIIIPEFNDPKPSQEIREFNHASHSAKLSATTSSDPLAPNCDDPKLIGSQHSSCLDSSAVNTNRDDPTQRLNSAYPQIRSIPHVLSPRVSLSSDSQILQGQPGVLQHSVLNHPNYSLSDLPNLSSTRKPTPPTTSQNVSQTRTSKNSLRIDTNVYPASSSSSPDPPQPQPAQTECRVTARTLTRNSPECGPFDEHTPGTRRPQPSIPNSLKLPRRRLDKTIFSLSSPPSRGVLRNPAASSPPLTNTYRRQTSLPQIRPPSPFKVDIPLHHTWHDRRTKFYSSSEYYSKISQFDQVKSRRTSGSTEVLASLAWIGTPPITSSPFFAGQRHQSASPTFFPDHFRMAIAVEDDSISDDDLIDRLEKVRRIGSPSELSGDMSTCSKSSGSAHFSSIGKNENENSSLSPCLSSTPGQLAKHWDALMPSATLTANDASDSEDVAIWQATRKVVLCIREIVRTEKKYQEALKMLLNAQTATPPPSSMVPHVLALVRVSETLLKHFLEDPSAWGVSTAFVTSEDELEATMVSWCAVAGAFFTDGNDHDPRSSGSTSRWRLRKSGAIPSGSFSMAKQTSTPLSPQLPPMFGTVNERSDRTVEGCRYPLIEQEKQAILVSRKPGSADSAALTTQLPTSKLSVRDIAIQPVQRVMRYVLLYRDLLNSTPPASPSRLLVERAVEAAARIARHCDRAQRNPAFYYTS